MQIRRIKQIIAFSLATVSMGGLSGCGPEVGSPEWCQKLLETPKGDWTANEAKDYAKY